LKQTAQVGRKTAKAVA